MKVLVVEPYYAPYEKEINGLHEMQAVVGGLIQPIYPYQEQVALVCNEEGLINGLPFNRSVEGGYGGVFGTFFVCGLSKDNFCSLTPEQMERFKKRFHNAEILIGTQGNTPVTLKVPPEKRERTSKEKGRDILPGRE
ncbi:MAG: DUF3846 domain-containing protein [Oscillospiraceae bacterium]|nr:DUF3846 domain-containing protein [Oscillospiraceae bacterium]